MMSEDKESKVGKKLSEFTTRKVVILVLIMLFTSPVFTVSTWLEEPNSYNFGLDLLKAIGPRTEGGDKVFWEIVAVQTKLETPLIDLYVDPGDGEKPLIWTNKISNVLKLRK